MVPPFCLFRNTPTHVGKTLFRHKAEKVKRKHPHARGEDLNGFMTCPLWGETPPRTWGRLRENPAEQEKTGNTPTHVGKTGMQRIADLFCQKHPHARGEDYE